MDFMKIVDTSFKFKKFLYLHLTFMPHLKKLLAWVTDNMKLQIVKLF